MNLKRNLLNFKNQILQKAATLLKIAGINGRMVNQITKMNEIYNRTCSSVEFKTSVVLKIPAILLTNMNKIFFI